ncbi:MAG: hypothetical protein SGPRY_011819 [Prymnesium sp.]
MRISDSDFLVDGWQYASGISDEPGPDGRFLPEENATQWTQGPGPLANHDAHNANAVLSFVPINNSNEALRLLPRVPTLRAHRRISKGEEITFNYGSSLPFASVQKREEVTEIPPVLSCEAGKLRAVLEDLRHKCSVEGECSKQFEATRRAFHLLFPREKLREYAPQLREMGRLLGQLEAELDACVGRLCRERSRLVKRGSQSLSEEERARVEQYATLRGMAKSLQRQMSIRQAQLDASQLAEGGEGGAGGDSSSQCVGGGCGAPQDRGEGGSSSQHKAGVDCEAAGRVQGVGKGWAVRRPARSKREAEREGEAGGERCAIRSEVEASCEAVRQLTRRCDGRGRADGGACRGGGGGSGGSVLDSRKQRGGEVDGSQPVQQAQEGAMADSRKIRLLQRTGAIWQPSSPPSSRGRKRSHSRPTSTRPRSSPPDSGPCFRPPEGTPTAALLTFPLAEACSGESAGEGEGRSGGARQEASIGRVMGESTEQRDLREGDNGDRGERREMPTQRHFAEAQRSALGGDVACSTSHTKEERAISDRDSPQCAPKFSNSNDSNDFGSCSDFTPGDPRPLSPSLLATSQRGGKMGSTNFHHCQAAGGGEWGKGERLGGRGAHRPEKSTWDRRVGEADWCETDWRETVEPGKMKRLGVGPVSRCHDISIQNALLQRGQQLQGGGSGFNVMPNGAKVGLHTSQNGWRCDSWQQQQEMWPSSFQMHFPMAQEPFGDLQYHQIPPTKHQQPYQPFFSAQGCGASYPLVPPDLEEHWPPHAQHSSYEMESRTWAAQDPRASPTIRSPFHVVG